MVQGGASSGHPHQQMVSSATANQLPAGNGAAQRVVQTPPNTQQGAGLQQQQPSQQQHQHGPTPTSPQYSYPINLASHPQLMVIPQGAVLPPYMTASATPQVSF